MALPILDNDEQSNEKSTGQQDVPEQSYPSDQLLTLTETSPENRLSQCHCQGRLMDESPTEPSRQGKLNTTYHRSSHVGWTSPSQREVVEVAPGPSWTQQQQQQAPIIHYVYKDKVMAEALRTHHRFFDDDCYEDSDNCCQCMFCCCLICCEFMTHARCTYMSCICS